VKARRRCLLVLGFGAPASQAGHLLAYQLRFGAGALQVQSSGAHAYFPTLAKTGLGLLGMTVLGAALVVGVARVLAGRGLKRDASGPSYLGLLAALYTLQLAVFGGQETAESAVAGMPGASVATLLLWGTLGQLPIAAAAALALRWLATRFEAAVEEIKTAARLGTPGPAPVAAVTTARIATTAEPLYPQTAHSAPHKRGPPLLLRISRY
jgi:hypothetical protein